MAGKKIGIHHGKLTRSLNITHLKEKLIFQASMFGFHVDFPRCKNPQSCSYLLSPYVGCPTKKIFYFFEFFYLKKKAKWPHGSG